MADMSSATRLHPLRADRQSGRTVSVTPAGDATRISLRARPDAVAKLSRLLGLSLPTRPKSTAVAKDERAALWLGPDEWLLIDGPDSDVAAVLARAGVLHSAVDVSHRNVGIIVSGEGADRTISGGCPQDLSLAAFPVGAASRTVLGKIEVIVWRTGEDSFRIECWRSFSEYAYSFLQESAKDCGI